MTNKKYLIVAVLATFCLTATLFMIVPTRSQTGSYDPWEDVNDDGSIDMADISIEIANFMANGIPINKTALLLELQSRMDDLNASVLDLKAQFLALLLGLQTDVDSLNASVIELQSRVGDLEQFGGSLYRWNVFDTYMNMYAWLCGNDPSLYGGVPPNRWTDSSATAEQISSDKEVLRTLFCQKGYGGMNATVYSNVFIQYSSTTGRVVVCLFRIRNTMDYAINWTPYFRYTCYDAWGERASVALNGALAWTSGTGQAYGEQVANVTLSIPANRTSTVIFVSTSSPGYSPATFHIRSSVLAFCNNSLALPAGLKYVDDLDTATGGWDQ